MKRLAIAVAALAALAAFSPDLAAAETTLPVPPPTGNTETIFIRGSKSGPRFVAPKTVAYGDELRIVNQVNARRVGPFTFSLVEAGLVPKTASARQRCFTPHHICTAIALWHGVEDSGPPTINPVEAGQPGWDTEGNLGREGDSWFSGYRPNASFEQQVSAEPGTTLHFICAIHPWMHGSIEVLPAPTIPPG